MRDQDDLWLFREQTADPDELDADFMDWLKDGLSDDVIDWVAVNAGRDSWTPFGLDLALYWTEAFRRDENRFPTSSELQAFVVAVKYFGVYAGCLRTRINWHEHLRNAGRQPRA